MGKLIYRKDVSCREIGGIKVNASIPCNEANYTSAGKRSVGFIVIHYTGNEKDTAQANASYFHRKSGTGTSAHYFVDENSIYESVPPVNRAWHCGANVYKHPACRNTNSIGIEMCSSGNYTVGQKTLENAAYLAAWWCVCLGIAVEKVDTYVLRHYDVTGKICPLQMAGKNNQNWAAFKQMVRDIMETGHVKESDAAATVALKSDYPAVPFRAIVTASTLNVRASAGTTDAAGKDVLVVSKIHKGDTVTVLETSLNGWGRIGGGQWISLSWCDIEETLKSPFLIAQAVLNGKWGNGDARREKLRAAGYDPVEIQKLVNALSRGGIRVQITVNSTLTIRSEPNSESKKLDSFGTGVFVTVEEVQEGPGASAWGRIGNGWISLDWVKAV